MIVFRRLLFVVVLLPEASKAIRLPGSGSTNRIVFATTATRRNAPFWKRGEEEQRQRFHNIGIIPRGGGGDVSTSSSSTVTANTVGKKKKKKKKVKATSTTTTSSKAKTATDGAAAAALGEKPNEKKTTKKTNRQASSKKKKKKSTTSSSSQEATTTSLASDRSDEEKEEAKDDDGDDTISPGSLEETATSESLTNTSSIAAGADDEDNDYSTTSGRSRLNRALRENKEDAARAMGDAIRDRADQWFFPEALRPVHDSVTSVGWALGASDYHRSREQQQQQQKKKKKKSKLQSPAATAAAEGDTDDEEEDQSEEEEEDERSTTRLGVGADAGSAGVETSSSSVLAYYFLKSHGGAHALQTACSLLATVIGLSALVVSFLLGGNKGAADGDGNKHLSLVLALTKRCLMFACAKHAAGSLAAAAVAANAIPEIGLSQARLWMERLAADPVSQYLFYTACLYVWLPPSPSGASSLMNQGLSGRLFLIAPIVLGPVLLREVVSTALVASDVLVLWLATTNGSISNADEEEESTTAVVVVAMKAILRYGRAVVDAIMSVLVTPAVWRSAANTAADRQAIVAKLVSRVSLAFEVMVGAIMLLDSLQGLALLCLAGATGSGATASATTTTTTTGAFPVVASSLLKRMLCARLYLHFLWSRRKRIRKLATRVRGGAAQFPFYVLDVCTEPKKHMGILLQQQTPPKAAQREQQVQRPGGLAGSSTSTSSSISSIGSSSGGGGGSGSGKSSSIRRGPVAQQTTTTRRRKNRKSGEKKDDEDEWTWKTYLMVALGMDD